MTRIGLCMIVKNEAHVIRRCLDSALKVIDHVLIVDTGSSDGTQDAIRAWLREKNIPGQVIDEKWRDFAYNRTFALERLRERLDIDYALMMDADEILEFDAGFNELAFKASLAADVYNIAMHHGTIVYARPLLVRNAMPFRFKGVLHEYLECPEGHSHRRAEGFHIRLIQDSARNKNPRKYQDDARVLERALASESDPFLIARYTFYLAQSYKDFGENAKALEHYAKRAQLGYWDQEIYLSLLYMGDLKQSFGLPAADILDSYTQAIKLCPARAEAYHAASRYFRALNRYAEGAAIAKPALDLTPPGDGLFVVPWIYNYGLLDEYAVNAYWAGHFDECLRACQRILALPGLDADLRQRVANNAAFARAKLGASPAPASPRSGGAYQVSDWTPGRPQAGTELMVEGLRGRLGERLAAIDLRINMFSLDGLTGKKLVVWFHHNTDQEWVQWCRDPALVARVDRFVFVSHWQLQKYVSVFGLPRGRCTVLRNAVAIEHAPRQWHPSKVRRLAYTSTPFRGLSVLLDAWDRLRPADAELNIWSSMKLYGDDQDNRPYADLFERAGNLPGVFVRGIVPNAVLREELQAVDFLAYPSTFEETSCLSVIEAMAAGCRVICPALGALPETTAGFARMYAVQPDAAAHAAILAEAIGAELANAWQGSPHLAWAQQNYCRMFYDWSVRVPEWQGFLDRLADADKARP